MRARTRRRRKSWDTSFRHYASDRALGKGGKIDWKSQQISYVFREFPRQPTLEPMPGLSPFDRTRSPRLRAAAITLIVLSSAYGAAVPDEFTVAQGGVLSPTV